MRTRSISAAVVAGLATLVMAAGPAAATGTGQEGCSPGYWKNHTSNWQEYAPTTRISWQWTIPASLGIPSGTTMQQALAFPGGPGASGGARILLRASVAAYLNAAHDEVGYPYRRFADTPGDSVSPMKVTINAALASGDRATMINLAGVLDAASNLGCPLN